MFSRMGNTKSLHNLHKTICVSYVVVGMLTIVVKKTIMGETKKITEMLFFKRGWWLFAQYIRRILAVFNYEMCS